MGEETDDFGETVRLEDVEELEGFLQRAWTDSMRKHIVKRTISNPYEPSIMRSTRSATFAMSTMELRSLLHSTKVILFFFPLTTVTGPCM